MDDLSKKLEQFLSEPGSMDKIQSALSAFGLSGDGEESAAAPTAASAMPSFPPLDGMPDMSMIAKLAPLLTGMGKDDQHTALLKALRPYLHGEREKRLDDAIRIMRLVNMLPLLREKGLME